MDRGTKGSPWSRKESDMTERLTLCFQKITDVLTENLGWLTEFLIIYIKYKFLSKSQWILTWIGKFLN